jgi:hypothetical protein
MPESAVLKLLVRMEDPTVFIHQKWRKSLNVARVVDGAIPETTKPTFHFRLHFP